MGGRRPRAALLLLALLAGGGRPAEGETTEVAVAGEQIVSANNTYCVGEIWLLSCDFNGTDEVVVIPSGFNLDFNDYVAIDNAEVVHVYPTCLRRILIFSTQNVSTIGDPEVHCRVGLIIYNSIVDRVKSGVRTLHLYDSDVNLISLSDQEYHYIINSTIEALEWTGTYGTIANSTVKQVRNVTITGYHHMANTLTVTNTTIGEISSQGLCITRGNVNIMNVTVNHLEKFAVNFTEGFLSLNNVSIARCTSPCIIATERDQVSLQNVTIGDDVISTSSEYLRFIYDPHRPGSMIDLKQEIPECSVEDTTLCCNFTGIRTAVTVKAENVKDFEVVKIQNAIFLHVMSTSCGQKLYLENIRGGYFDSSASQVGEAFNETCKTNLVLNKSTLATIDCGHVSHLELTNSTVKRVHKGTLKTLNILESNITEMDNVTVNGERSIWDQVKLGSINMNFGSPVEANNLFINNVDQMKFDHANMSSNFSNISISVLPFDAILLRHGNVSLVDSHIKNPSEGAVTLEEKTFLKLKGFSGRRAYPLFSVASENQVMWMDGFSRYMKAKLIHVRWLPPRNITGLTINSFPPSSCSPNMDLLYYGTAERCSISNYTDVVNLDISYHKPNREVIIENATRLNIFSTCFKRLSLKNVKNVSTYDGHPDCTMGLRASNVHFENITTGVHGVHLNNCTVEFLAADHELRCTTLWDTHVHQVRGIDCVGYVTSMNKSRLDIVEGLLVSGKLTMSETHIGTLLHDGLTVLRDVVLENSTIGEVQKDGIFVRGSLKIYDVHITSLAEGAIFIGTTESDFHRRFWRKDQQEVIIEKSTIGAVQRGGIFVNGTLTVREVHITSLAEGAIVVAEGASALFENVSIGTAKKSSFVSLQGCGVTFWNVRIGGKQVIWSWTVMDNQEEKGNLSTSTAQSSTTEVSISGHTSREPKSDSGKWIAAGSGFLFGFLVACSLFIAIRFLKQRRRVTLPTIFWRVKDNQDVLLVEDEAQEAPDHEETSGYRRVHDTDVLSAT